MNRSEIKAFICNEAKKTMGNQTSDENWAARERLLGIERWLWWKGYVGRRELRETFGLSAAQASSDLQKYQELNPGCMNYHLSRKRYEAAEGMGCVLGEPDFASAVRLFLGGGMVASIGGGSGERVEVVGLPARRVKPEVERSLMNALLNGWKVKLKYSAVHSRSEFAGKATWVYPQRLVWDGTRWHCRLWCESRQGFRDFVLGRIQSIGRPEEGSAEIPVDEEWEQWTTLVVKPNPKLSEGAREALILDYQMGRKGHLKLKVRKALEQYLRERLGDYGGGPQRQLVITDGE